MTKFMKLAVVATLAAAPMGYAVAQMTGSGVTGTGVDFMGGTVPVANNPGVTVTSSSTEAAQTQPVYKDYGVVRGILELDAEASERDTSASP